MEIPEQDGVDGPKNPSGTGKGDLRLSAQTTLGSIELAPELLPINTRSEYIRGVRGSTGGSDRSFLSALRLGYSFQVYVGTILLAHGFWTRLHPLCTRPDAQSGRDGSYSDAYDLLGGVQGLPDWGEAEYAEVERRVLRLAGSVASPESGAACGVCASQPLRGLSFQIEVKARGQEFLDAESFPYGDLILEPESRFSKRDSYPDLWAAVSQVTGAIVWFPSALLGDTFTIRKGSRLYRTAPTKHFFSTQDLSDYLTLRWDDDLLPDDA